MLRLSPELAAWAMIEGYGKTLSRDRLDTKSRELCIVAQLTQLGWERQLYSHILGSKNVGASHDEIAEAVAIGAYGDVDLLASAEQLVAKIV
jgi:alkylhydroperoxidase/carboxymuconolactone decarboxylase family protein YurZ